MAGADTDAGEQAQTASDGHELPDDPALRRRWMGVAAVVFAAVTVMVTVPYYLVIDYDFVGQPALVVVPVLSAAIAGSLSWWVAVERTRNASRGKAMLAGFLTGVLPFFVAPAPTMALVGGDTSLVGIVVSVFAGLLFLPIFGMATVPLGVLTGIVLGRFRRKTAN